jgi:hypothetical protein
MKTKKSDFEEEIFNESNYENWKGSHQFNNGKGKPAN